MQSINWVELAKTGGIAAGGEQLHCASLAFLGFYFSLLLLSSFLLVLPLLHFIFNSTIKLFLSQPTSLYIIFSTPPHPTEVAGSEQEAVWGLVAGWG